MNEAFDEEHCGLAAQKPYAVFILLIGGFYENEPAGKSLLEINYGHAAEIIFLRGIIAELYCHIALLHRTDPPAKLDQMMTRLQGTAAGLADMAAASGAPNTTVQLTKSAEMIRQMAESMLVRR